MHAGTGAMMCDVIVHQSTRAMCMRKMTCEVYLSTLPVGYSGSPSTVNETNCKKMSLKKFLMSSTNFWTCPTMNRLRKGATSFTVLEKLVLQPVRWTHDEDGF